MFVAVVEWCLKVNVGDCASEWGDIGLSFELAVGANIYLLRIT
jgi:hypothetical protein